MVLKIKTFWNIHSHSSAKESGPNPAIALNSSTRSRAVTLPASIGTSPSPSASTPALVLPLRLELGLELGELRAAVVDRLYEGEVFLAEQSIAVLFIRLVVLHADGGEGSELAAMNDVRVQHEEILGHADKCDLHLIRMRLDLIGIVGQFRGTQVESGHGNTTKRANLLVSDRLQNFVDRLLLGEALEGLRRLMIGRLRAYINQIVKWELREIKL